MAQPVGSPDRSRGARGPDAGETSVAIPGPKGTGTRHNLLGPGHYSNITSAIVLQGHKRHHHTTRRLVSGTRAAATSVGTAAVAFLSVAGFAFIRAQDPRTTRDTGSSGAMGPLAGGWSGRRRTGPGARAIPTRRGDRVRGDPAGGDALVTGAAMAAPGTCPDRPARIATRPETPAIRCATPAGSSTRAAAGNSP